MPLLDHFHAPLSNERHWESFHAAWCGALADELNRQLPPGYFAEEQSHSGPSVEIDVATWEQLRQANGAQATSSLVGTLPSRTWSPPAPALTIPAVFANDFEVRVFSTETGPRLVAAIEIVSPRNKDRAEARRAFTNKCAGYLYQGISLILVDVVTNRHANLHNELLGMLQTPAEARQPAEVLLYAAAYRPIRREEGEQIDIWPQALALSDSLPIMPLALNAEVCLPVDLEATYADVCRRRRLP
jgi:hypothetical protein